MNKTRYSATAAYSPDPATRMAYAMAPSTNDGLYLEILDAIKACRTDLDIREHNLVQEMRHNGTTWDVIGALFGITRQAAHQRFGN